MVGYAASNSRIRGSTASTIDPAGARSYFGGPSEANAARTVLRDTPITRAIALIAIPSDRCNRRISAQSSTLSTLPILRTILWRGSTFTRRKGVSFQDLAHIS